MHMSVQADYILGSIQIIWDIWLDSDQTTPAATPTVPAAATPARKQEEHPQMFTKETKFKSNQKARLGTHHHRQSSPMCDPSRVFWVLLFYCVFFFIL